MAEVVAPTEVVSSAKPFSVWIGAAAPGDETRREVISVMLSNAGYAVQRPTEVDVAQLRVISQEFDAAFLILGTEVGLTLPDGTPLLKRQYEALLEQVSPSFRLIVWAPQEDGAVYSLEAQELLAFVENTLTNRVMLTRTLSLPVLVQEVRAFLSEAVEARQAVKQYEIGFIHNVRDAESCFALVERLSGRYRVQTLAFRPDQAETDVQEALRLYRESQLLVLFFHRAGDWAVAVAQQLWKAGGGLSSPTPMLLIGLPEPIRNRHLKLSVPNIRLELAPIERMEARIEACLQEAKKHSIWPDAPRLCPYIGLRPFEESESLFFHGRERHIEKILEQLRTQKFVMVTGASGDGKSSLVFAGL